METLWTWSWTKNKFELANKGKSIEIVYINELVIKLWVWREEFFFRKMMYIFMKWESVV